MALDAREWMWMVSSTRGGLNCSVDGGAGPPVKEGAQWWAAELL